MKTQYDVIQEEIDQLHFEKALQLLKQLPWCDAKAWYQKGLCYAAMYASSQAEQAYQKALENSSLLKDKVWSRLLALYIQTGQLQKAKDAYAHLLEKEEEDFLFYKALYLYETGDLFQALKTALHLAKTQGSTKMGCEAWTFCGDLYSALGEFEKGVQAYNEALEELEVWPENWRNVRKALILNNLADLYEQFEFWEMAQAIYEKAWLAIDQVQDADIYDLNGYRLEILLSMANFQGLIDEFEKAHEWLKKAKELVKSIPKPAYFYWLSRIHYLEGLCELYRQNPNDDPFENLFLAWQLQEKFLSKSKAASKEYLGRIAYYAAYTYNPAKAQGISQKALYKQALALFEECAFKDPKFFGFTIASIQNEMGNLERWKDPPKALTWYRKALFSYDHYLATWPEDGLAQSSLLVVLLNLLSTQSEEDLIDPKNPQRAEVLLDRFETALHPIWEKEDTHEQGVEALEHLLENETLYSLYPQRLEAIHSTFIQPQSLQ